MKKLLTKKVNEKGFTLAELLIVVAIIAVLVAIAIPIFTTQLEKSREATDKANIRSAYGELVSAYLSDEATQVAYVDIKQRKDGWQSESDKDVAYIGADIAVKNSSGASTSASSSTHQIPVDVKSLSGVNYYKVSIDQYGDVKVSLSATNSN